MNELEMHLETILFPHIQANTPSAYLTDNFDHHSFASKLLSLVKPLECVHFTPDGGERRLNVSI